MKPSWYLSCGASPNLNDQLVLGTFLVDGPSPINCWRHRLDVGLIVGSL